MKVEEIRTSASAAESPLYMETQNPGIAADSRGGGGAFLYGGTDCYLKRCVVLMTGISEVVLLVVPAYAVKGHGVVHLGTRHEEIARFLAA